MPSDMDLLAAWAAGDAVAGETLVGRHFGVVSRFFLAKTRPDDAEDLIQKTFEGTLKGAERIRGESGFRAYLMGVARNVLLRYIRDKKRSPNFDAQHESLAESGFNPVKRIDADENRLILLRALRRIPLDDQIALELYYWEGHSVAEVAEALELGAPAVKSRLFRARKRLAVAVQAATGQGDALVSTSDDLERWRERVVAAAGLELKDD